VCRRESQGVAISLPGNQFHQFCSEKCARIFMTRNITPKEKDAAVRGGQDAGQYLDSIGKTDLATLSADEWAEFCGTLFKGACDELARQADDEIPF
jgi:hypothetical protein